MADHSGISQLVQIGVEVTEGTAVAANKRLRALSITPQPQMGFDTFTPQGNKVATLTPLGKDWTQSALTGRPTFDELAYPLASVLMNPTPSGSGAAKTWVFTPSINQPDTCATYTVEWGDATQAYRFANGKVTAFGMNLSRDRAELTGTMIGTRTATGITLTATPTAIPTVPTLPTEFGVFMDSTSAGLGTTRLGRCFAFNWNLSDRFGQIWPIDDTQTSFAGTVETLPRSTLELTVGMDAVGVGLLADARAGTTQYLELVATGPIITGSTPYSFTLDCAANVNASPAFEVSEGLYVARLGLTFVDDGDWDKFLEITLVNTLAAL